jgi:hypothetical protein
MFGGATFRNKKRCQYSGVNMGWNTFEVFFASPVYPELSKFRIYKIKSVCLFQPLPLSFSAKGSLFMGFVKK